MGPNLNRQKLYSNLIRGVYALEGLDGEFLGQLCQRIPFNPGVSDWQHSGVLAVIPSNRVAALEAHVGVCREAIGENREDALGDWTNDAWVSLCYRYQLDLKADLAKAELALAASLA